MPISTHSRTFAREGERGFSMYGRTREHLRMHVEESGRRARSARQYPAVLRSAGVRIEPTSAERLRIVAGNRQPWQQLAWAYRDMIGELAQALKFRSRNISRAKFYIAQVDPDADDDEPIPVSLRHDKDKEKAARITLPLDLIEAAEEELGRLPLHDGYGFLGVWSENFDVAGECYLHGYTDPYTQVETWKIRSVDDVDVSGDTMSVKDELGRPRRVDLDAEELYRMWIPHPRRGHLADSVLNPLMDVLEDITLIGRELRAAARSRIASNGVWMLPNGLAMLRNTVDETDAVEDERTRFSNDLTAAMLAPIGNEGEAGAVVPILLTGTREDIEVAAKSFIRFDREDSPTLLDKLTKSLSRMGTSLDIPPEILTGMADVNHWTAWQIDAATFRQYLEPSIRLMVDSLTAAMLHAALVARGFSPEEVRRVRVWYNADSITENPNRRQDALDARDRNAIGDKAFRDALGFNDGDAPTPEEVMLMVAGKNGFDQATAAQILHQWAVQQDGADALPLPPALPRLAPSGRPPAGPEPAAPDPSAPGGTATPATAPPAVAAAGAVTWTVPSPDRPGECHCGSGLYGGKCGVAKSRHDALMSLRDAGAAGQPLPNRLGFDWQEFGDLIASMSAYAEQAPAPAAGYQLDTATGRALMEIDRAVRDKLLDAADAALTRAQERGAARLRSKATRDPAIRGSLAQYAVVDWPAKLGRTQAYALGADSGFLLAQAWDELAGKFTRWVTDAVDRILPRVLKLAGRTDDGTAARLREEMTARIPTAWDHLQARLDELADRVLFGEQAEFDLEGEIPDVVVPPYLVRAALAEVGGLPETSGGLDSFGRPVTGEPANGLHNGATVSDVLEDAGVLTVGYLWVYGITPMRNQFEPHAELEGVRFTSWRDERLDTAGTRHEWVGPYFRPGDHRGCMCDFVPGYAVPDYAAQVRERLAVPPGNMAEIIALAEDDDRAGRRGTTAQELRDRHGEIQRLQSRFLDGA